MPIEYATYPYIDSFELVTILLREGWTMERIAETIPFRDPEHAGVLSTLFDAMRKTDTTRLHPSYLPLWYDQMKH